MKGGNYTWPRNQTTIEASKYDRDSLGLTTCLYSVSFRAANEQIFRPAMGTVEFYFSRALLDLPLLKLQLQHQARDRHYGRTSEPSRVRFLCIEPSTSRFEGRRRSTKYLIYHPRCPNLLLTPPPHSL
ncbi:hypothetical protein PAXRUDRAFT_194797 [Paxillus rubicundulus Ve08.2h10]|uniref:Uncharacterized protein n=1 Tax=Paxillus rubicundulus Ve08.2h10 TaxID=930991 RepID=A0A0D0DB62_9AGAM|nr:hypothetical protein PAXRUDRAFT_194797 [Paxillus rubicundulus Ve08.2h10]